jgi:putative hydrolase of the HAD superfamily
MRFRLVCFDGDDTLWDFDRSMRDRLERVLEVLWSERMDEATAQLSVDGLIRTRERVAEELEGRVLDLKAVRLAAFERSLEDVGAPDPALAEWMAEVYFEDPTFEVFDDAAPALSQIAAERVVSVVTNGDVDPASLGLGEWVSHTVNAPRVGVAKPDGRIFEHALAAAGVNADEAVHVGDSPRFDIAGGAAAGLATVLIDRWDRYDLGRLPPEERPDAVIRTLAELPGLLERGEAGGWPPRPAKPST